MNRNDYTKDEWDIFMKNESFKNLYNKLLATNAKIDRLIKKILKKHLL